MVGLPRLIGAAAAVVIVLLWILGAVVGGQTSAMSAVTLSTPEVDPVLEAELAAGQQMVDTGSLALVPGGGSAASLIEAPPAFAAVQDVALHLPAQGAGGIVFREADIAAALPLAPVGTMTENANPAGYTADRALSGPAEYTVDEPISGVRPATGMAAVLAAPGTALRAPVQGTVASVTSYETAQGTQAWRLVLQPRDRSDLHVVVRGIETPFVSAGDEVTVGRTELGLLRAQASIEGPANPLSLPAALVHVQPAVGVDAGAPS